VLYQTGFSRQSLHSPGSGLKEGGYFRYTLGEDGLVAEVFPNRTEGETPPPPFPLADLISFLAGLASPEAASSALPSAGAGPLGRDLAPPLLVFLLTGPVFLVRKGKPARWMKKTSAYYDKRIAA
jgi:hypothetical protein